MQTTKVINYIVQWLKDYTVRNPSVKGFAVGISDGIDSAVVSTLCARTTLPLLVLQLPIDLSKRTTNEKSVHIRWLENRFGCQQIHSFNVNLTEPFESLKKICTKKQSNEKCHLAFANVQARLRMVNESTDDDIRLS